MNKARCIVCPECNEPIPIKPRRGALDNGQEYPKVPEKEKG